MTTPTQLLFDGIVAALKQRGASIKRELDGSVLSQCPGHGNGGAKVGLRIEIERGIGLNDDKVNVLCQARSRCKSMHVLKTLGIDPSAPPPGAQARR
jgi:hypothetical protein